MTRERTTKGGANTLPHISRSHTYMRTHTNDAHSCFASLRIDSQIFRITFGDLGWTVSLGRRASAPSRVNRLRSDWPARRECCATQREATARKVQGAEDTKRTRIAARALCGRKTGRTTTAGAGPTSEAGGDRTTRIIIVIIGRHVDRVIHPTNEGAGGNVRYADSQQTHRGGPLGSQRLTSALRTHTPTRTLTDTG